MSPHQESAETFENRTVFASVKRLCLQWRAAQRQNHLPNFEDVALGSLGQTADDVALLQSRPEGGFTFLTIGGSVASRLKDLKPGQTNECLAANYRNAFERCFSEALAGRKPVLTLARDLASGLVETCEVLALPLRSRWHGDLVLLHLKARPTSQNLVEAIYRSTTEGILAVASVPSASAARGTAFQVVSLNQGAASILGRSEQRIRWSMLSELVPESQSPDLFRHLGDALRSQSAVQFEFELPPPEGRPLYLRASVTPIADLAVLTLTDITDIKQREESVKLLFASNPIPLILYDRDSLRLLQANDAMVTHYGYTRAQLLGMEVADLHLEEERAAARTAARSPRPDQDGDRLWTHARADGSQLDVRIHARSVSFEGRSCLIASIVDVTEQNRAQKRMAFMAHHDSVTSLANRVLFRNRLDEGLQTFAGAGGGLAVHLIDLDFFKRVNDTFGHSAGDEVLREAARRIQGSVRGPDLVARLGGDEFAVLQVGCGGDGDVGSLSGRLVRRLAEPYLVGGQVVMIGASIGIAVPDGPVTAETVLKQADVALYEAKARGKGQFVVYSACLDAENQDRRDLEADLSLAIGTSQLALHYQPLVEAATKSVVGFEALLRWFHPVRGPIAPGDFIPLAERTGLIGPLGDWVLNEACREAATWPSDVKVAVNLSPAQFRSSDIVASVTAALHGSRLPPSRLEVEITESVVFTDSASNCALLRQLHALGVTISLDDFGTGYSSLSYLRDFPVGKIKIDRSFVRDLDTHPGCLAIIRAVTGLGRNLGIATLAEGIETAEQFARLKAEGCTQLQGFWLGRPASSEDTRRCLARRIPAIVEAA